MTPEEADALAAIVEAIDGAGGTIRETDIEHERDGGVNNALAEMMGGDPSTTPVFEFEVIADPDEVLDEDDAKDIAIGDEAKEAVDEAADDMNRVGDGGGSR